MKIHIALILSIVISHYSSAQSCNVLDEFNSTLTNTITEAEYTSFPWYNDSTFLDTYYNTLIQRFGGAVVRTDIESVWLRVPVVFWVYRDNNGGPGSGTSAALPTELNLQRIMDDANNSHVDNGINFRYYINSVRFIDNSSFVVPSNRIQRLQMVHLHRIPNAMNVHIVNGGGSEFFWDTNAIFIERDVYLSANAAETFTHEIGHFFGLLHTHFGFNVPCFKEPVSRGTVVNPCPPFISKRCRHTGDLLCDTAADPNMSDDTEPSQLPSNNNCTYVRGQTDFYGRVYTPQVSNYMAYGNFGCSTTFTDGQKKIMNWFAFGRGLGGDTWLPTEANSFDRFEPDNADVAARVVPLNILQTHSFHQDGRTDNVDWYRFQFASTNQVLTYRIEIGAAAGSVNPVQEVKVYLRTADGSAGLRITGLNTFIQNGKQITEIPCYLLTPNQNYLIEVIRGTTFGRYNFLLTGSESLSIIGSDVCTSIPFSVANLPVGTPIVWSSSNPNGVAINSLTGVATRVNNFNGQVILMATISGACGNINFTKTVTVGTPPPTNISGPNYNLCRQRGHPQEEGTYHLVNPIPNVTYHWEFVKNSGATLSLGSGLSVTINASAGFFYTSGAGTHTLRVRSFSCGQFSTWHSSSIIFMNCSMARMTVFPNPSSEELNVNYEIDSLSEVQVLSEFQVSLINSVQEKVYSVISNERSIKIPVGKLPKGIYYLTITNKEGVIRRRILIDR
jgi:hypothetical protein